MQAIVWDVTLGPAPTAELLFPKGEEDGDHLVATVPLPDSIDSKAGAFFAARAIIDMSSPEQLAAIKATARPIDRDAVARA